MIPEKQEGESGYSKAILNILEDSNAEKTKLEAMQKAVLNILDDSGEEKAKLSDMQNAVLNILADSSYEKIELEAAQKAVLNILDDFDAEKKKVERINIEMAKEIEERKAAEEALRKAKEAVEAANKELEAFSYSVSHDLRAPLRSIDGFSQILLEDYADKVDDQGNDYLKRVRAATQRMAVLIDDMLKLSRLARSEMHLEKVDLSALANSIAEELQKSYPERSVEFSTSPGMFARGDSRLLQVTLENLLSNAWKFTSRRSDAKIEFGTMRKEGKQVYFIRDNGIGFDMTYVDKLFAPFQRLHSMSEFPGTGVGLAIVQRVFHRHGGTVWAEGEKDKGATFYFTL